MLGSQESKNETDGGEQYELANSHVTLECGPAGVIARIERLAPRYSRDYAGPLPTETLDALREAAGRVCPNCYIELDGGTCPRCREDHGGGC